MQTFIHIHMQARIKTMYTYGADLLANAVLLVPAHGTAALQHCWPLVICSNSQVSLGKWRYTKEAMHPRTHWKTMGHMLMCKDGKIWKIRQIWNIWKNMVNMWECGCLRLFHLAWLLGIRMFNHQNWCFNQENWWYNGTIMKMC